MKQNSATSRLSERLRQGIDPNDIPDAEAIMDTAADELDDLRKANALLHALVENRDAEIARLRAALEKITDPLTLDVEGIGMHRALLIIRRVQEIAQKALGDAALAAAQAGAPSEVEKEKRRIEEKTNDKCG